MIPGLPALQQVAQEAGLLQGAAPQGQAQPISYSSSPIVPVAGAAVQPLARAVTDLVDTGTSAAAKAVAGVLGTVGQWVSDAAPSGEESSSSSGGATPEPFVPVSPEPFGSSFVSLFSGSGQTSSAGGAGATTLLLGVLVLASTLLLRRDFRTYLVSCELPKPSSALLSPLERPG
jgi:hypothetical protein